ncbi:MAG: hypothetical protein R3F14_14705 [Polyangiaceae bacterium]
MARSANGMRVVAATGPVRPAPVVEEPVNGPESVRGPVAGASTGVAARAEANEGRAQKQNTEPPPSNGPVSSGPASGEGWTAEAYGIYWDAYTAARKEARKQGKSQREAQRLGREAGELAAFGRVEGGAGPVARTG